MADAGDAPNGAGNKTGRRNFWKRLARRLIRAEGGAAADVAAVLHERESLGEDLEASQKSMILKAAWFDRLRVEDAMRPRAEIVAVEASATLGEAAQIFSESQHSRLPIYRDTLDDPIGLLHVRDVVAQIAPDAEGNAKAKFSDRILTRIKREILFVPPSMKLSTLFLKMQQSRIHLALVVDEYGGTDGLVSMEDLVEQIVGEIDDEHDDDAGLVEAKGGAVEADGRADVEQVARALSAGDLSLPEHEDEFDTIGGLVITLAGRVPQRGEIIHHPAGFDVEVVDADPRRVKRVRVRPAPPDAAGPSARP